MMFVQRMSHQCLLIIRRQTGSAQESSTTLGRIRVLSNTKRKQKVILVGRYWVLGTEIRWCNPVVTQYDDRNTAHLRRKAEDPVERRSIVAVGSRVSDRDPVNKLFNMIFTLVWLTRRRLQHTWWLAFCAADPKPNTTYREIAGHVVQRSFNAYRSFLLAAKFVLLMWELNIGKCHNWWPSLWFRGLASTRTFQWFHPR